MGNQRSVFLSPYDYNGDFEFKCPKCSGKYDRLSIEKHYKWCKPATPFTKVETQLICLYCKRF
jgi:hypothetical protein